jgi:hypothetical protein
MLLAVLIIIFLYMFGHLVGNQNWIVMSKDETFHLLFSALLIVSVGGIIFFSCTISSAIIDYATTSITSATGTEFSCAQQADLFSYADCFLGTLESKAKTIGSIAIRESISKQMDGANAYSIYLPFIGGTTTMPQAYKRTQATMYDTLFYTFISPAMLSLSLQRKFIYFMGIIGPAVLLPLAFILRVIPLTRNLGNMFIGLSIGILTIFPMMYAINGAMYNVVFGSCDAIGPITDDYVLGPCGSTASFSEIARIIPQAFFLPNLTLAIFITFLGAVAKALRVIG